MQIRTRVTPWGRALSFVSFRDRSAVYGLGFCAYDRQSLGRCSPSRDMLELRQPLTNLEKALPTARSAFAAGVVQASELADGCQGADRFSSNLYAGNVVSLLSKAGPPTVKW